MTGTDVARFTHKSVPVIFEPSCTKDMQYNPKPKIKTLIKNHYPVIVIIFYLGGRRSQIETTAFATRVIATSTAPTGGRALT